MRFVCLYIVASLCSLSVITGQGEVDTGNPYLTDISNFAAAELIDDDDFGLAAQNFSLLRILDAQFVAQPPPTPSLYLLTLEFGSDCNEEVECDSLQVCEATVADNTVERKRFLVPDKSRCAGREMNEITEFNGNGIASSLAPTARETRVVAGNAVTQMSAQTGEKVSLRDVQLARKVTDGSSVLFYLTLNVSSRSPNGSSSNEICDVIMEENAEAGTSKGEQQLRSFQCFDHDDEADRVGVVRNQQDELSLGAVRHLAQTALPYAEAGLVTRYQLKLLGFSLIGNRVSPDTGMRETRINLGITPTFCIKREENEEEDTTKTCTADTEREPSLCRITVIQWPWLPEDNYLFSDLACAAVNYSAIAKLTPYVEELPTTAEEDDAAEIGEVESNIARSSNREIDDEDTPCAGCPVGISKDDPAVRQMAEFALSALDQAANSNYLQYIVRVIQATHQVVAGSKYDITLELADTSCRKTSAAARANRQSCTSTGKNKKICTVSVLDQPWIPNREVLQASCGQK